MAPHEVFARAGNHVADVDGLAGLWIVDGMPSYQRLITSATSWPASRMTYAPKPTIYETQRVAITAASIVDGRFPEAIRLEFGGTILPGATRMERFVAHGRNPHSDPPMRVASWPAGPDWPPKGKMG